MKIAIISDLHSEPNFLREALEVMIRDGASYILNAGDSCLEENLKIIKKTKLPNISVFGNNDFNLLPLSCEYNIKKEPYYFKIEDLKFKIMHMPYYLNSDTDIIISGHTHKSKLEYNGKTMFINPGELCGTRYGKSSAVLLEIKKNEYITILYSKSKEDKKFQKEIKKYER